MTIDYPFPIVYKKCSNILEGKWNERHDSPGASVHPAARHQSSIRSEHFYQFIQSIKQRASLPVPEARTQFQNSFEHISCRKWNTNIYNEIMRIKKQQITTHWAKSLAKSLIEIIEVVIVKQKFIESWMKRKWNRNNVNRPNNNWEFSPPQNNEFQTSKQLN